MIKKLALVIVFWSVSVHLSYAFWIWTPESKKWTNPKYAPKESPQEQLNFAKSYYDAKDYVTAYNELKKLIKYYPDAVEAPEALYYQGLCLEEMAKYYEAFQAYQKIFDKYPFSHRTEDVLEREYIVAQRLLDRQTSFLGLNITHEDAAIEIFRKVVENAPYGKFAPASQYKIGLTLKAKGYFMEATEEFQKVLDTFPESEWAEPARFQIAVCTAKSSLESDYDQSLTQEAKDKFDEFLRTHPDAELSTEAAQKLDQLAQREAQSQYDIGVFYEKQRAFLSAKIYYDYVIEKFPSSPWAEKAQERLQKMQGQEAQ